VLDHDTVCPYPAKRLRNVEQLWDVAKVHGLSWLNISTLEGAVAVCFVVRLRPLERARLEGLRDLRDDVRRRAGVNRGKLTAGLKAERVDKS